MIVELKGKAFLTKKAKNNCMKNKNISIVYNILSPLPLTLEQSSARRRFLRVLEPLKSDYDLEGEEIRKEFAIKNADGSLLVVDKMVSFTKENRKLADAKFAVLNDLEVPVSWKGEEKDRDAMVKILNDKIAELNKATEFNNQIYDFIITLEEAVTELNG